MSEVVLFDVGVGPDLGQQEVFIEQPSAVTDEHEEGVERLRQERDGRVIAQ